MNSDAPRSPVSSSPASTSSSPSSSSPTSPASSPDKTEEAPTPVENSLEAKDNFVETEKAGVEEESFEDFSEAPQNGELEMPDEMYFSHRYDREQLVIALFVLLMSFLLQVNPAGNGVTLFGIDMPESCLYKEVTDQNCAGCGLTRSFILAVQFSPETFDMNRVGFIWLIVILAQIPYRSWRIIHTRRMIRLGLVDLNLDHGLWFWQLFRRALILSLLGNWIFNLIYQKGPP